MLCIIKVVNPLPHTDAASHSTFRYVHYHCDILYCRSGLHTDDRAVCHPSYSGTTNGRTDVEVADRKAKDTLVKNQAQEGESQADTGTCI